MTLPKYETIEIKEFPLEPDFSGDIFFESEEYIEALDQRKEDIFMYIHKTATRAWAQIEYPSRIAVRLENDNKKTFLHISNVYYAPDYSQRFLISKGSDFIGDIIYVIFQKSISK